jgi:hypothetical protein
MIHFSRTRQYKGSFTACYGRSQTVVQAATAGFLTLMTNGESLKTVEAAVMMVIFMKLTFL